MRAKATKTYIAEKKELLQKSPTKENYMKVPKYLETIRNDMLKTHNFLTKYPEDSLKRVTVTKKQRV